MTPAEAEAALQEIQEYLADVKRIMGKSGMKDHLVNDLVFAISEIIERHKDDSDKLQ